MRFRCSKAAGSFDCTKAGTFELLIHIEADPNTESFAEFDFATVLPPDKARELSNLQAFLLRHRAGIFVISTYPAPDNCSPKFKAAWQDLDTILARRSIWLLAATTQDLRREPQWSHALEIARCAQADLDPSDQDRIIAHLSNVGSDTLHACMKLCTSSADSNDAVLRLVANGTLYLDPPDELTPSTALRLEPPAPPSSITWAR